MPLSDAVIAELRAELEHLRAQEESIARRLKAIRLLLGESEAPSMESTTERGALKKVILDILRTHRKMKAAQVTTILRSREYQVAGKTDLHHRVYNELFRLYKAGVVRRNDGTGDFEMPDE
jgi:hypothetical protein